MLLKSSQRIVVLLSERSEWQDLYQYVVDFIGRNCSNEKSIYFMTTFPPCSTNSQKCKKKSWRNFVCILMWILFKETTSTCMIFLQSLQQHINHIPRWWARIFSAYKMISCSLFETFYSLFLMENKFSFSAFPEIYS